MEFIVFCLLYNIDAKWEEQNKTEDKTMIKNLSRGENEGSIETH